MQATKAHLCTPYLLLATAIFQALAVGAAPAATLYWDGAVSSNWETASNWSMSNNAALPDPATPPGTNDTAFFSISSDLDGANPVLLTSDQAVYGVTINPSNTAATVLQGGGADRTLTIGPGGLISEQGNSIGSTSAGQKVNVLLNGSQRWVGPRTGSGVLSIRNAISRQPLDSADRTLLLDVGLLNTQSANLQGGVGDGGAAGALTLWKTGDGTLSLSATNTHSGGTIVQGGTLTVTTSAAMPTNGPLILRGGQLYLSGPNANYTHNDLRIEAGVNTISMDAGATFDMGTITRSGGTLRLANPSGGTVEGRRTSRIPMTSAASWVPGC
ncbi:MAG: autotransporter-associated beta strand repeat-containing protein [Verrucomicrobia bacterium]|nr:autotransporter-associated beta strand repeat-containing protein [Verrucomicrobiota bacterium]